MPRARRAPQVHKFGGASLADSAAVRHAVDIIRRHRAEPTVVVVSAMAGTTDALLAVAQQAGSGDVAHRRPPDRPPAPAATRRWRGRCFPAAGSGPTSSPSSPSASPSSRRWPRGCACCASSPRAPPTTSSPAASGSARTSSPPRSRPRGTRARYVEAPDLIHTDAAFGRASPDYRAHRPRVQRALLPAARARHHPGGARLHRLHARGRARDARAAAAPTLPPRCSAARLAPSASRSGRTCPASSPPIRGSCPTPGSSRSSTPVRPPSWRTTAPRCSTLAR